MPRQIGQAHVEQHEIGRLVVGHAQRRRAVVGLEDVISPLFALLAQRPTNQPLVVDDQTFSAGIGSTSFPTQAKRLVFAAVRRSPLSGREARSPAERRELY